MSKLSKVLYLCLILVLTWLAVMPYWPTIQEEAKNIYATWQAIRDEGEPEISVLENDELPQGNTRERSIAKPKPAEELPALVANTESLDPFIREARERAKEDPEAAMQWLQEQSTGTERLRGMLEVVALWAAKDSESALLWLESNAQGIARLETLNSGVEMWAERDPQAAAGWIDGMANDGSKITAAKSLAATWVKRDPAKAAAWVEALPNGSIRDEASRSLTLAWAETDPAQAALWALDESRRTQNKELIAETIQQFAKIEPSTATEFVRDILDPFEPTLLIDLVAGRTEQDPLATAEWLSSLAPDDPINKTFNKRTLMQVWAKSDSIAASAWLSEQPLGEERDAAIAGFAETIQKFEPEAAATWADTISNPDQRTQQLTQTIRTWAREQPHAALKWVINSDLAPAEKEQLASEIGWD